MKKLRFLLVALLAFAAVACERPDDTPDSEQAPVLLSTEPADGQTGIAVTDLRIALHFDQNVSCPTASRNLITLEPGAGIVSFDAHDKALYLTAGTLEYETLYTLTIPSGCVKGLKENQEDMPAMVLSFTTEAAPEPEPEPVRHELSPDASLSNPSANSLARQVYSFLLSQVGKKTLSGVQSPDTANNNDFVNSIASRTGFHPALAGYDFIFEHYSPTPASWSWKIDYSDMSAPIEQWEKGGLVAYMWHWNVPTSEEAYKKGRDEMNFDGWIFYTDKTSFDIREVLKEGTWQHDYAIAEMDKVAGYLKILKDNNIPVLWRPFHEASGNTYSIWKSGAWFWWGRYGAEPCKALWKKMYERFTKVHGLDNLIWVWTIDYHEGAEADALEWYPGNEYVDIVGADIYADGTASQKDCWQFLVDVTEGRKLVTISECGNVPDPAKCFEAGEKWSWWMVWSDDAESYKCNTESYWKALMTSPYTITRESMPKLK